MKTTDQKFAVSFIDAKGARKNVEIEITYRNGYKELSICDDHGQGSFVPANDAQKALQTIWSKYHLNGMHAGTEAQEEALKSEEFEKYKQAQKEIIRKAKEVERIATGTLRQYTEFVGYKVDGKLFCSQYMEQQFKTLQAFWYKKHEAKHLTLRRIFDRPNDIQQPKFEYNSSVHPASLLAMLGESDYQIKCEFLKDKKLNPDNGYSYGSAWLHRELPADIEEQIEKIISEIEEAEEERKGEPLDKLSDTNLCKLIASARDLDEDTEEEEISLIAALVRMFDLSENDLSDIEIEDSYSTGERTRVTVQGIEYIAGTDDQIDEEVKEYIKDSIWAFNSEFLASQTDLPVEAFQALSEKCESGNDGILRMVEKTCGLDDLVTAAVQADGRGHFLNRYDGGELSAQIGNTEYFAYRQ